MGSRSYFYFEAAGFRAVCRWDFQAAAEAGIAGPAVYLCVCVCVSVSRLTCCRPADPSPSPSPSLTAPGKRSHPLMALCLQDKSDSDLYFMPTVWEVYRSKHEDSRSLDFADSAAGGEKGVWLARNTRFCFCCFCPPLLLKPSRLGK